MSEIKSPSRREFIRNAAMGIATLATAYTGAELFADKNVER